MKENRLGLKKAEFHSTDYPGVVYLESSSHSPDGKIERVYYIRYRSPDGRQRFEKAGGQRRHKMTPAKASAIRAARSRGTELPNQDRREAKKAAAAAEVGRWTFDKLWKAWQEDPENTGKRGTTKADQRYRKHLKAPFGDREPKDLVQTDLDRLRLALAKNHAKGTVISILGLVRRIANYGFSRSLCPGLQFPMILRNKTLGREPRTKRAPTDEQIAAYVKTCKEWPDPQAGAFQLLIVHTGMRRGSARNLKWEDLDLDNQTAVLRDSKTGDVQIVLSNGAVELLRSHPSTKGNPFVFAGDALDGGRSQRQIDRIPAMIRDAAGLPADLDPCHAFRRNLATQGDKEGISPATIMRLGGWKTPAMVMHYTATTKATLRAAANLLGRKIAEAKEETA